MKKHVVLIILALAASCQAEYYIGTGNWMDEANWSLGYVPFPAEKASINMDAVVTVNSAVPICNALLVGGMNDEGDGYLSVGTLNILPGAVLASTPSGGAYFGNGGTGNVNMSGGSFTCDGPSWLGYNGDVNWNQTGGVATFYISPTGMSSDPGIVTTVNVTGGRLTLTGHPTVGGGRLVMTIGGRGIVKMDYAGVQSGSNGTVSYKINPGGIVEVLNTAWAAFEAAVDYNGVPVYLPDEGHYKVVTIAGGGSGTTRNVPSEYSTIQAAIDASDNGDKIIVASGVYTGSGNRDISFNGKALTVCSATGNANDCIIDCQGSSSNNHRGFVFSSGEISVAVLEGFKIKNGFVLNGSGGGILCNTGSPTIRNCIITNCATTNNDYIGIGGGGVYSESSSPSFYGCRFVGNSVVSTRTGTGADGGAACTYYGAPKFTGCSFVENSAGWGGAVFNQGSEPFYEDCIFERNTAGAGGTSFSSYGNITYKNCLDTAVSQTSYEAHWVGRASMNLLNCTFVNLGGSGSIITIRSDTYAASSLTIKNSILWSNGAAPIELDDHDGKHTALGVTYNDIRGGWAGTGNLNADPGFAAAGDYHLRQNSPCVNKGDPNYIAAPGETDLDYNPRVLYGRIDMGAYEFALVGDFDFNGRVEQSDLGFLTSKWLNTDCSNSNLWCERPDINHNGLVDFDDFALFAQHWLEGM